MEQLESSLNEFLKTGEGMSILLELDANSYSEKIIKIIKELQKKDLGGVYISIQRPFKNISSLLEKQGINLNKIIFIDIASAASKDTQEKYKGCVHISPELDVDELVRAIYTSLDQIKGQKFIFIDSLTTLALHKPISEILRFFEFLMRHINDEKDTVLILNVAKDLSHNTFVQNITAQTDKTIEVKV